MQERFPPMKLSKFPHERLNGFDISHCSPLSSVVVALPTFPMHEGLLLAGLWVHCDVLNMHLCPCGRLEGLHFNVPPEKLNCSQPLEWLTFPQLVPSHCSRKKLFTRPSPQYPNGSIAQLSVFQSEQSPRQDNIPASNPKSVQENPLRRFPSHLSPGSIIPLPHAIVLT